MHPTMTVYVDGLPQQRPYTIEQISARHSQLHTLIGNYDVMEPCLEEGEEVIRCTDGKVHIIKVGRTS